MHQPRAQQIKACLGKLSAFFVPQVPAPENPAPRRAAVTTVLDDHCMIARRGEGDRAVTRQLECEHQRGKHVQRAVAVVTASGAAA